MHRSSPPLRNEPYVGGPLEQQEAEQTSGLISAIRPVSLDGDTNRLNDLVLDARRTLSVSIQAQAPYSAYPDWTLVWALHDMAGDSPGNPFPFSNPARQSVRIGRLGFDWSLNFRLPPAPPTPST